MMGYRNNRDIWDIHIYIMDISWDVMIYNCNMGCIIIGIYNGIYNDIYI